MNELITKLTDTVSKRKYRAYLVTLAGGVGLCAFGMLSGAEFVSLIKVALPALIVGNYLEHREERLSK